MPVIRGAGKSLSSDGWLARSPGCASAGRSRTLACGVEAGARGEASDAKGFFATLSPGESPAFGLVLDFDCVAAGTCGTVATFDADVDWSTTSPGAAGGSCSRAAGETPGDSGSAPFRHNMPNSKAPKQSNQPNTTVGGTRRVQHNALARRRCPGALFAGKSIRAACGRTGAYLNFLTASSRLLIEWFVTGREG